MKSARNPEVITVASGKGGTGKTLLLVSLGYALLKSGHRVLFVDFDLATEGLSHFILGENGVRAIQSFDASNTVSGYVLASEADQNTGVHPRTINRGEKSDQEIIYEAIISGRGIYGDDVDKLQDDDGVSPSKKRKDHQTICKEFFDELRSLDYDYILVDTRGGFGILTTAACALSDSYFLVTEPTSASLYQNRKLQDQILEESDRIGKLPMLRGAIVNKAVRDIEPQISKNGNELVFDPDEVERRFRSDLAQELAIEIADTYAIPSDLAAIETYAFQRIPFSHARGSIFALTTIDAFSGMMSTVTVEWPMDRLIKWNGLVDDMKTATKEKILQKAEKRNAAVQV